MTETEAEAAPTCYRHPDRETYVRCTRCDRAICPDCMNTASVGFQCPECVREGSKSVRQARTTFGGRVGGDEAMVTKAIIGVCVLLFLGQLASAQFTADYSAFRAAIVDGEYYRMITSAFLHSRQLPFHILFNMYALFAVGSQIERLLGGVRFLVLYVVAAFGGSVLSLLLSDPRGSAVGASGAIFGLFGAFFVLARRLRLDTSQIVTLIGINLVFGLVFWRYIDNYAHIGGLVTGAAVAFAYAHAPRGRNQALLQFGGAALVTAVLVVATAVRVGDLRQDPRLFIQQGTSAATTSGAGAPSR